MLWGALVGPMLPPMWPPMGNAMRAMGAAVRPMWIIMGPTWEPSIWPLFTFSIWAVPWTVKWAMVGMMMVMIMISTGLRVPGILPQVWDCVPRVVEAI